jgi:signal transduction histidine kinase
MKSTPSKTGPGAKRDAVSPVSLLWRIFFSTSIAITILFLALGLTIQEQFVRIATETLEQEARASFQAYESLWRARADQLATVSLVLSRMPDVRAAFGTRDKATIRDTAREVWDQLARPGGLFLVCSPDGAVIASIGSANDPDPADASFVRTAARRFPQQARGFVPLGGTLYQIVVTPIYVATGHDAGLLNVLVAGVAVDNALAQQLKSATGESEFVFLSGGRAFASTLGPEVGPELMASPANRGRVRAGGAEYYQFVTPLAGMDGTPAGELRILRSFRAAGNRISEVRTRLAVLWFAAVLGGLGLTYLLAKRLLHPVKALDRAASEIATGNYHVRVPVTSRDEMGRLAETFNSMCDSINSAREELIRQERISTIGRFSTSIIHDLRNPLAAIYGGAEMLVDAELTPAQVHRLSANIYKASRQIQNLLQELADVTQGRAHSPEICRLREIVQAAYEPLAASADSNQVQVHIDIDKEMELPLERSPMERVFQNLIGNAIEAMPEGGSVVVSASRRDNAVLVSVEDTGPGIPDEIANQLFKPFVTAGKKNGMGLGLALSRKTVLSHGGDLWAERKHKGARFLLRLPG